MGAPAFAGNIEFKVPIVRTTGTYGIQNLLTFGLADALKIIWRMES